MNQKYMTGQLFGKEDKIGSLRHPVYRAKSQMDPESKF